MSVARVTISGTSFGLDVFSGTMLGGPASPLGMMTVNDDVANGLVVGA